MKPVIFKRNVVTKTSKISQPHYVTHPHLLNKNQISVGITREGYALRRKKLLENIPNDSVVILPASRKFFMCPPSIPYQYRQNTNFFYLSGFQEPCSVIVLEKTKNSNLFRMFVQDRDPKEELWNGPMAGVERVSEVFGADSAHSITKLSDYLRSLPKQTTYYFNSIELEDEILQQLQPLGNCTLLNIGSEVEKLRVRKTPEEVEMMKASTKISSESFVEVIKATKSLAVEKQLEATMEYHCLMRGSTRLAYPPVVANGINNNIIHYLNNDALLEKGQLILMDAAGEYHHYVSDITRTWPYGGVFTAPQKELYNEVLNIQKAMVASVRKNTTLSIINQASLQLAKQSLKNLGFPNSAIKNVHKYYPHSTGHYLGMDVHDTPSIGTNTPLDKNMIITIEPGIYIPHDDTDVPERFRGIGIRIEDDVLITDDEPYVLTAGVPKEIDELEHLINS